MSGLRTALFVSVAVNILLVGVIGGAALSNLRHDRAAAQQAIARAQNIRAVLEAVPPERRAPIREKVVTALREGRPAREEAREARAEVYELTNRPAYDPAAVKSAYARMRAAEAKVAEQLQNTVADAMSDLNVEERRTLLRHLAERRARMAGRHPFLERRLRDRAPVDAPPPEEAPPQGSPPADAPPP